MRDVDVALLSRKEAFLSLDGTLCFRMRLQLAFKGMSANVLHSLESQSSRQCGLPLVACES